MRKLLTIKILNIRAFLVEQSDSRINKNQDLKCVIEDRKSSKAEDKEQLLLAH